MRIIIFLFFFLFHFSSFGQKSVRDIIQRMNTAGSGIRTAAFTIYGEERLKNGDVFISERNVKLIAKPKKVYFYSVKPDPGMEVLWKEGPGEKMTVNPGGFPYITLHINHNGAIARKDSHHAIHDMGFDYVVKLINYYMQTQGENIFKWAVIKDTLQWQGLTCIHLAIDFKDYPVNNYTVLKGENLSSIAAKLHVNDYMILSMNNSIDDMDDVEEGQRILVPGLYASRIEFYIDMKSWLPVRQLIYDQKGLYEKYEVRKLKVNPVFKPEEFTEEYKDYKF